MQPARAAEPRYPVYLVRHGETESNLLKRYAGRSSESLTPHGRFQAQRIARLLCAEAPCAIYSSRIVRALETAKLIATHHELIVQADARLDELLMGPWEGLSESEVASRYPGDWELWSRQPHELKLPGRETLTDVAERVMSIAREVSVAGPTILVTHVAAIRVATLSVLELPLAYYKRVEVPNASCIRLDLHRRACLRFPGGDCVRSEVAGRDGELAIA